MARIIVVLVLVAVALLPSRAPAAIDKLQKEDGPRLLIGLLNLYFNIGKGVLEYGRDTVMAADDMPKAIATDVFQVGQKNVPGAYYATEEEKKARVKQKREEEQLHQQEKKDKLLQQGSSAAPPITAIQDW
ncbi:MAG: hypothetical protein NT045_07280 [Candidatus Aureabacteria bacterium]|nr:hypothetical protein [Candidatus Auribacterota bacterium]